MVRLVMAAFFCTHQMLIHTTHVMTHNSSLFCSPPLTLFFFRKTIFHPFPPSLLFSPCVSRSLYLWFDSMWPKQKTTIWLFRIKTGRNVPLIRTLLFSETSLWHTCVHAHAHRNRPRMAWECFPQPRWLPVVTSEMVFISYVDSEMLLSGSVSLSSSPSLTLSLPPSLPFLSPLFASSPRD